MTTPNGPTAYVAEPIDFSSGPSIDGHRVTQGLSNYGVAAYRPATAWHGGVFAPGTVETINRVALLAADVVIANLATGLVSYGTPMEIEAATAAGIPAVVLWPPATAQSVSLRANPRVAFVASADEAVELAAELAQAHYAKREIEREQKTADIRSRLETQRPQLRFTMALGHEAPRPALADDSGMDLVTAVDTTIPPHTFVDIPSTVTGIQIPEGMWALITGRSSAIRKRGLLVPNGVIDHGWRGPLMAGVYNLGTEPVTVLAGERVAQVILMPNATEQVEIVKADRLDPHERGLAGFGSTGGVGTAGGGVSTMTLCAPADPGLYSMLQHPGLPDTSRMPHAAPVTIHRGGLTLRQADELPGASEGERMQALDGPGARPVGGAGWPQTVEQEAAEYARVDALHPVNPIG
jgi:dUTP pyrophosphatase